MKVIFVGSPQIAAAYLEILSQDYEIPLVITQAAKAKGRGLKMASTPVAEMARKLNIKLLEVTDINSTQVIEEINNSGAQLGIVVAFGQLIKKTTRESLVNGFINLHFSLLPELRGADPVTAAISRGLTSTGVSVFELGEELDSGPLYITEKVQIDPEETTQSLFEKLFPVGKAALMSAVEKIKRGEKPLPQSGQVSYAPKTSKADYRINWTLPNFQIERLIRSGSNSKFAWTTTNGLSIKFTKARCVDTSLNCEVGETRIDNQVIVQTGSGALEILEVIPEGKRVMSALEWARGVKVSKVSFK